ncbi:hypothetical protein QWJ07_26500 [Frankia sp. RB7]|nr:hypothetical protein [Frankia sp. RB7]
MPIYQVHFSTDAELAIHDISGDTPAQALAAARALAAGDHELYFEPYAGLDIDEIIVMDDDGYPICAWRSDAMRLRLAASDLLIAAREVVASWDSGDLAAAVRNLAATIAEAEPLPDQAGVEALPPG